MKINKGGSKLSLTHIRQDKKWACKLTYLWIQIYSLLYYVQLYKQDNSLLTETGVELLHVDSNLIQFS